MNAGRFAEGFERDPRDYLSMSRKEWRKQRDAIIDPAMRWAHLFSQLMDDYLTGESVDPEVKKDIRIYGTSTNRRSIHNAIETAQQIAFYRPEMIGHLQQMNFHVINQEMDSYWLRLIDPELYAAPDYIDLSVIQTRLAIQALHMVENRRRFYDLMHQTSPEPTYDETLLDQSFVERITKVDTAIALLEVVKQQPIDEKDNLILLPAPPKYEAFKDRSSDFILFDTKQWQAHGVRVEVKPHRASHLNEDFVSRVDSIIDLGNSKMRILEDGAIVEQPVPGLIAADFILNSEGTRRDSSLSRLYGLRGTYRLVFHGKEIARTMQDHMDYTDRAEWAAERIGPRIMRALYENSREEGDTAIEK